MIHLGAVDATKDRVKQFGSFLAVGKPFETCHRGGGLNQFLPSGKLVLRCKVKPPANNISVCLTTDQSGDNSFHGCKEPVNFICIKLAQSAVKHRKIRKGIRLFNKIFKAGCRYREVHGNERCIQIAVVQFHNFIVILFCNRKTVILQTLIYIFLQMRNIRIRIGADIQKRSEQLF